MPPTPTPLPPPSSLPITMPDVSLWDMTDPSIQMWNSMQEVVTAFQAFLLLGVILFIVFMLYRYAKVISVERND